LTREYGEQSIKFAFALAANKGLRVDIHCDETDDDQSRFVEVMAAETIRLGMGGRVTASHTTAMHSYNNAYAYRLINNLKRAQMDRMTWNPASALGLEKYGLLPGCRADLCAFTAPTEHDAIRLISPRKLVLRGGKIVARTEPERTTVMWNDREELVDFLKPA